MASPIAPSTTPALSIMPEARVSRSPLSDESIWRKFKEAGFDEESIKRRDKAVLIAYIAKLETEIFEIQHSMGLLILEKRELDLRYEQIKASAEATELMRKCDQASHLSNLAEASIREEKLKKALAVEKECLASIEKTLHEMRAESAEAKVAAEAKLAEAHNMMEEAQKKILDAEAKLPAAEALQAEASRYHHSAERKLQELVAREEDFNRHMNRFKSDCDTKERDINLEKQSLRERRTALQKEQERLLDSQALMNQREDIIASKSQELNRVEKELESVRTSMEKEKRVVSVDKHKLELTLASFSQKEEDLVQREALLVKREQELLILQEKLARKETVEIQNVIANHETSLKTRKSEFELELEIKRKLVEDEMDSKRRALELKEIDFNLREELVWERDHELEVKLKMLTDKDKEIMEKMSVLDVKEQHLSIVQNEIELKSILIQKEKEEIMKIKSDLQKSFDCVEDQKKQVYNAKEKLETMKSETNELSVLEIKLKEEVDLLRTQKSELFTQEDRLKVEKAKFESEWELIDEKREELCREVELVAKEKEAVLRFLKDERDNISLEKETIRQQLKQDTEVLNFEREEFNKKMVQERSELFSKIQKEHADFLLALEMQKRELECSIEKRREEIEGYLRDKENAFELEKNNEYENIRALREKAEKELEQVALEMRKLDNERTKVDLDRERRDKEWSLLNKLIEELKDQTQKLEQQRELLHLERQEISDQIEQMKKMEDLKLALDSKEVAEMQQLSIESCERKLLSLRCRKDNTVQDLGLLSHTKLGAINNSDVLVSHLQKADDASPSSAGRFSWIKRCNELISKSSFRKSVMKSGDRSLEYEHENDSRYIAAKETSVNGGQKIKSVEDFQKQARTYVFAEPKVILEVPPGSERTKGTHDVESEIREDSNEMITCSNFEQSSQAKRKRSVDSCSEVHIDSLPDKRQDKKRQKHKVAELSEDAINQCVSSTPESDVAEATGSAADVQIADKIIKVMEVTCEVTRADILANQEEQLPLEEHVEATVVHNTVDSGGSSGHDNLKEVEVVTLPCTVQVSDSSKEKLVSNAGATQLEDDMSKNVNPEVEDSGIGKSENGRKVTETAGMRTRSKQKHQQV